MQLWLLLRGRLWLRLLTAPAAVWPGGPSPDHTAAVAPQALPAPPEVHPFR
ncbi:hypothetical protein SAMN05216174_101610 [Actinokineospora iranica]|uniref:Uncharacterized protein n=1 Tax=Actinokineospora iranica TaxID=1271860 RepID=A0A1G6JZK8_9PSEU|nr:hypothetical protein SAMN05216174_101610 [Actinokineospora iranica]